MGHYDSSYESEHNERIKEEIDLARDQLKLMQKFTHSLSQTCGDGGISQRHLDAFEDMLNETRLRAKKSIYD